MNSLSHILHTISYMALPLFLAMVLHEYAHGWVANRYGDATARLQGRLTLNPLVHIDPFGSIILPLMCLLLPGGFFLGWAKPVPVNPAQLRNPRRDMALVAAAGPGMNLLLAILSAIVFSVILSIDPSLSSYWSEQQAPTPRRDVFGMLLLPVAVMSAYSVLINLLLMLFNLLPIPPLDGGRIMTSLLPPQWATSMVKMEPYGMLIIVGLILLDPHIHVIQMITGTMVNVMAGALLSTMGVH
ncbi:MAG TPA: site-2 protease family protein [Nitrospiraceae bacterium]|nr:site-2 protease family protein [Nitrospiraceae bacterium]